MSCASKWYADSINLEKWSKVGKNSGSGSTLKSEMLAKDARARGRGLAAQNWSGWVPLKLNRALLHVAMEHKSVKIGMKTGVKISRVHGIIGSKGHKIGRQ